MFGSDPLFHQFQSIPCAANRLKGSVAKNSPPHAIPEFTDRAVFPQTHRALLLPDPPPEIFENSWIAGV
jgi:hypothetical protein